MKCPECWNPAPEGKCSACGWAKPAAMSGWDDADPHVIALRQHHRVHRHTRKCAECGEKAVGAYGIVNHWQEDHPELYRRFKASVGDPRGEAA